MATVSIVKPSFLSPLITLSNEKCSNLSLITLRKMEGHGDLGHIGENFDPALMIGRLRDDDYESRSGSENFDGASGDDQDAGDDNRRRKKKYHRHTPQQIQELETFFKECPHPDEKQRSDLSKRLGLEVKQVKFWFQNRRTQMKTQLERHENMILRQENEKLRAENTLMKEALTNPTCATCGGVAIPIPLSGGEHEFRIENARLKEELNRICTLAHKFLGRPLSSFVNSMGVQTPNSGLELGIGRNGVEGSSNFNMAMQMGIELGDGVMVTPPPTLPGMRFSNEIQLERTMFVDLALAAMDELINLAQPDSSLWFKSSDGAKEVLNLEEYARCGSPFMDTKPNGFVTDATRDTGILMINIVSLVETFMDPDRWVELFPTMIAKAVTLDVISSGVGGTRNGALIVMHAEVQLPSPFVPVRQLTLLRFCKQHADGVWAVVDASIDIGRNANGNLFVSCRKMPSGCVLQEMPNGACKIIWVDHTQYDENVIHQLYRPMVNSGIGFGAHRWVATLQRQCEYLSILISSLPSEDPSGINQAGRRSLTKLAQRMTDHFWTGICASSATKWKVIDTSNINMAVADLKLMSMEHVEAPGEAPGLVLSAATSLWLPVSRQRVFDFLREARLRSEWDVLSNGGAMQEMLQVAKGHGPGNCVSILRTNAVNANENNVLYLQDAWTDSTGSMIVFSPMNAPSLNLVMSGGDSSYVSLLPSGFSILPDGHSTSNNGGGSSSGGNDNDGGGCLLTFGMEIMLNNNNLQAGNKLTMESVDTVNALISRTIQKIKDALGVA